MSDYNKFKEELENNQELSEKFEAAQKAAYEAGAASDGELLVNAAKAVGYDITLEDLEKDLASSQELSDEDLSNVSGGVKMTDPYGRPISCKLTYHCLVAFMHGESGDSTDVACFKDYRCFAVYEHPDDWDNHLKKHLWG